MELRPVPTEPSNKPLVAFVDDDVDVLEITSELMQINLPQVTIVPFDNAKAAIAFIEQYGDEVIGVVSDLMMKDIDGIDFLDRIKRKKELKAIPFIFLSAADYSVFKNLIEPLGPVVFLNKPIREDALIEKMKELFRIPIANPKSGNLTHEEQLRKAA